MFVLFAVFENFQLSVFSAAAICSDEKENINHNDNRNQSNENFKDGACGHLLKGILELEQHTAVYIFRNNKLNGAYLLLCKHYLCVANDITLFERSIKLFGRIFEHKANALRIVALRNEGDKLTFCNQSYAVGIPTVANG